MLVSNLMVIVMLKMLNQKYKDGYCTLISRENQITTSTKLLNVIHKSYGFSGDLMKTLN